MEFVLLEMYMHIFIIFNTNQDTYHVWSYVETENRIHIKYFKNNLLQINFWTSDSSFVK